MNANSNSETLRVVNQDGKETGLTLSKAQLASDLARLEEIEQIDHTEKRSAVVQYWEALKGDKIKGIFIGWKVLEKVDEASGEVKQIPAVVIRTKQGDFINGSMQIADSFLGRIAEGAAVYIECISSKSGKMKEFDIRVLD